MIISNTDCVYISFKTRPAPVKIKRQYESSDTEKSTNTGSRDYRPSLIRIVWKNVNLKKNYLTTLNEEEKNF